jgi:hypothetical protein
MRKINEIFDMAYLKIWAATFPQVVGPSTLSKGGDKVPVPSIHQQQKNPGGGGTPSV